MSKNHKGLIKEENGTWTIATRVTSPDGKIKYVKKRGFKTQFSATLFKKKLLDKNPIDLNRNDTISFALDEYYRHINNSVKITTLVSKKYLLDKYIRLIYGDSKVKDFVTVDYLQNFMENVSNAKSNLRHKNRVIGETINFIKFLYNDGRISMDDYKTSNIYVKKTYNSSPIISKDKSIWTKEDYKKFISSIPVETQDFVLFSLWMHTGLRIGEIRGLQLRHIDFERSILKIDQQVTQKSNSGISIVISPKTKSSIRQITLSKDVVSLLRKYVDILKLENDSFIFTGRYSDRPIGENTLRRLMIDYCKKSGVSYISPHGIRHTNTTWLLSGKLSLEQIGIVSERLGHRDKTTTINIYYHINKSSQVDILNLLEI